VHKLHPIADDSGGDNVNSLEVSGMDSDGLIANQDSAIELHYLYEEDGFSI